MRHVFFFNLNLECFIVHMYPSCCPVAECLTGRWWEIMGSSLGKSFSLIGLSTWTFVKGGLKDMRILVWTQMQQNACKSLLKKCLVVSVTKQTFSTCTWKSEDRQHEILEKWDGSKFQTVFKNWESSNDYIHVFLHILVVFYRSEQ